MRGANFKNFKLHKITRAIITQHIESLLARPGNIISIFSKAILK